MTDDELDIQVYNLKSIFAINQQSLHNIQKISTEVGDIFYVDNLYKDVEKVKEFALRLPFKQFVFSWYNNIHFFVPSQVLVSMPNILLM